MANILLVEPDKLLANTYRIALENNGHTFKWSQGAQNAIHDVDGFRPDLVVLELQLAANNGVEFLYELRSYPDWLTIPIIVLSIVPKFSLNIPANTWANLGVVDYLYKPETKLITLLQSINRALAAKLVG